MKNYENKSFKYFNIINKLGGLLAKSENIEILDYIRDSTLKKLVGFECLKDNKNYFVGTKRKRYHIASINEDVYEKCIKENKDIIIIYWFNEKDEFFSDKGYRAYCFSIEKIKKDEKTGKNYRIKGDIKSPMINFSISLGERIKL